MVDFRTFNFLRICYEKAKSVEPLFSEKIPYMDITYCISGKMIYVYENKEYVLTQGDAIIYPAGTVRERKRTDEKTLYCSFNIECSDFEPEIKGYVQNGICMDTVRIFESIKSVYESVSDNKNEQCMSLFMYLYYQLEETSRNNENIHIKHIKKYIGEHYRENITLKQISDYVHLTPQYCCSVFSEYVGQTIFEFITNRRIDEAKSLIITSELTLGQIAEIVGFSDYNYFSRIFKKVTGVNAKSFRKLKKVGSGDSFGTNKN